MPIVNSINIPFYLEWDEGNTTPVGYVNLRGINLTIKVDDRLALTTSEMDEAQSLWMLQQCQNFMNGLQIPNKSELNSDGTVKI